MTYEIFLEELQDALRQKLEGRESIKPVQVLKNNGICLDGFSYQPGGRREQPTVYVNQYYEAELDRQGVERLADTLLEILRKSERLPGGSADAPGRSGTDSG